MARKLDSRFLSLALTLTFSLNSSLASFGQSPEPEEPGTPQQQASTATTVILNEGTPILVALAKGMRSDNVASGDPIIFKVVNSIFSSDGSHTLFVSPGAVSMGHAILARKHSELGRPGKLDFSIDYLLDTTGHPVYLRANQIATHGHDNQVLSIATYALVTPWALLIPGTEKKIDADFEFTVYVGQQARLGTSPSMPDAPISSAPTTSH